jgi:hypothetical protein
MARRYGAAPGQGDLLAPPRRLDVDRREACHHGLELTEAPALPSDRMTAASHSTVAMFATATNESHDCRDGAILIRECYLTEFIQQSLQRHPLTLLGGELLRSRRALQ